MTDAREPPLFLGSWSRSFFPAYDKVDEPHLKKRLAAIKEHPQITQFYQKEPMTFVVIVLALICQGLTCLYILSASPVTIVVLSYVIGGSLTGLMGVILHECTHNLITHSSILDRFLGCCCNLLVPIPISESFRRYHLYHHAYQGVKGKDPDLPMDWELSFHSTFLKCIWISMYPFLYLIRGAAIRAKPLYTVGEILNFLFHIGCYGLLFSYLPLSCLGYLVLSTYWGYSWHPVAAHFIQEHFTWISGQETYSYYGPLNPIFMNIGFHNEHHDFPKVPWSLLPDLKTQFSEYYTDLKAHYSWLRVFYEFLVRRDLGPFSRCVRTVDTHRRGRNSLSRKNVQED